MLVESSVMIKFINKFKIPTILGLGLIVAGIASGIFLVVKDQGFLTKASPDLAAQNITISNIEDTKVTISWQTSVQTSSFITFGTKNPQEKTVLDDRDTQTPKAYFLHYVTIYNLLPDSSYLFKIISGKFISEAKNFKTAKPSSFQNGFGPIIGTVFDGNNPLDQAIAYLSISDATIQSARLTNLGNFLIPISLMRKIDLSDTFQPKMGDVAKLTIISDKGTSSVLFKIKAEGVELPPINLGQNIDLTTSVSELDKFDLNGDRQINAIDYSEVLLNFGPLPASTRGEREASKNPKNQKADLNEDGVVDNKDLEQMAKKIESN